jgi:predicted alpha/beta hydrolase family esterase
LRSKQAFKISRAVNDPLNDHFVIRQSENDQVISVHCRTQVLPDLGARWKAPWPFCDSFDLL